MTPSKDLFGWCIIAGTAIIAILLSIGLLLWFGWGLTVL